MATNTSTVRVSGPVPPAVEGSWGTTVLLLRLRWRMIRSRTAKILIGVAGIGLFFALLSVINLGYLVQIAAQSGQAQASGIYAKAWIQTLQSGGMGSLGAAAVGGAMAVAVFAPFTGSSTLSLISAEDLACVRPRRGHRYFDALLINGISGIGILQFLALTAVTSLITLDGQRLWAMAFTWMVWVCLIALTTTLGFTLEWVQRRYGVRGRRFGAVGLLAVLGLAVLFDEHHGQTLFGLADRYTNMLRLSVRGFTWWSVVALAVACLMLAVFVYAGVRMTERALLLAPQKSNGGSTRWVVRMGASASTVAFNVMYRVLWRTRECRRPILAILTLGVPVVMFVDMGQTLEIALPMTIPLAVSLSWGVNMFGVLGRGLNWLGSQPKVLSALPRVGVLMQAILSFTLLAVLWLISWLAGRSTLAESRTVLIAAVTVAALTSAISLALSVFKPMRAPLTGAGDALVPPLTALAYLALLVFGGCVPGILIANTDTVAYQVSGIVVAVAVSFLLVMATLRAWDNPTRRARVIASVSSD